MKTSLSSVRILTALLLLTAQTTVAQLTGIKTIGGTSPDYTTISAAIAALNANGTAAPGVTFLIRSGTYTETATLNITTTTGASNAPIVFKPDVGATVTVNVAGGATGAAWNLAAGVDFVTIDGSNSGGTSRDMTIRNTSVGANVGIRGAGTNPDCQIKNVIVETGAASSANRNNLSCRGIDIFFSGSGESNNFLVENCEIKNAGIGIRVEGNSGIPLLTGIRLRNNTISDVGACGIFLSYCISPEVSRNTISVNLGDGTSGTSFGFSTGQSVGIHVGAGTTGNARIFNNVISNVTSTGTGANPIVGIQSTSANTNFGRGFAVFNNFIYGVQNTAASGTAPVYGILFTRAAPTGSAGPDTVSFNSISLTGTYAANRNSAAIAYTSATSGDNLFLRNNILSNTATYGTTGVSIGIFKSSTVSTLNSNNNDIWVGTPSTTRLTGRIATTDYQTMANWRTGSGQDANSVVENPPFTSATDLHIPNSTPTLLESGGVSITGQGFDIDDDTRSATAPDIGADEFNGIELNPPTITYSPLTNTASTSNRVLTNFATITDLSGVNTDPSTRPRIYYKKSTDPNTVTGWKFTEATNTSSPFSFTIDYSLISGGVAVGDVIQYFVVAQDLVVPTPNVGINSGTFASTPSSVALTADAFPITGTINSYSIVLPLSTSLDVGTGGNYPTLTGAGGLFQTINNNVLGGNTTVTIISDLTEDGTHALQEGGLGGFTLTIQPSGTRTVSGDVAGAMIDFNGADGVTINGLNSGGNSLTIRNTSTAAAATTIRFRNDATNNTITNCTVEGSTTNTAETAATIFIGGGITTGNDNITISNCVIAPTTNDRPTEAIVSNGTSASIANDAITISNCQIHNFDGDGIYFVGTGNGSNHTITNNSLYDTAPGTAGAQYGIYIEGTTSGNTITGNFIGGSAPNASGMWTNTNTAQVIGLFVGNGSGNTVSNNTVQNFTLTATGTASPFLGIVVGSTPGSSTVNSNTVQGITINGTNSGAAVGIQTQGNGNLTVNNNTVSNITRGGTAAGAVTGLVSTSTGTTTLSGNTVQNLTQNTNSSLAGMAIAGTGSNAINNNTIRALSGTNAGTTAQVRGIISTAVGTLNITNNQVRNLTAATSATGIAPSTAALGGIITNAANLTQTITDNTVDTLNATNGTAAVQINGIGVQNTGSGGTIARNYVYRLSAPSSTGVPVIDGINVYDANNWTVANNVVSITNGTGTNAVTIRGLRSDATSGTINFFYNSVFIGGSASTGSAQSFAFNRTLAGTSTINLRNNSLFNARTGGTGAHLAISRATGGTFSSNYNVIFASANPTQQAGTPAVTDFAGWQTATSGDANSINSNPQYHGPLNLVPLPGSPNNNAGTSIAVTTDILGATRSATTPDIGAFEFTGATPTASGSATAPTWGAIPGAFLTINSGPTSPSSASVTAQFFNTGRTGTLPGVTNQAQEYWAVSSNVIGSFDVTFDLSGIGGVGNVNTIKLFRRSSPFAAWQDISSLIYDRQTSPNRLSVILASGFSEFSLGGDSDNPLPVNLSAFTGRNIAQGVELRWQTASETDNAGFEVRRTELINGVEQEWLTIASYQTTPSLAGQGTTSQAHNYTYTDAGVQVGKTYRYALRSVDLNGTVHDYPQTVTVEVNTLAPKVYTYKLEQNYPNPFNPSTRIVYQVAAATNVKLEVFDMLGRKVATLVNERKEAGEYSVNFNASGLSSGVYFYRLQTDKFTQTKKLMLVK